MHGLTRLDGIYAELNSRADQALFGDENETGEGRKPILLVRAFAVPISCVQAQGNVAFHADVPDVTPTDDRLCGGANAARCRGLGPKAPD